MSEIEKIVPSESNAVTDLSRIINNWALAKGWNEDLRTMSQRQLLMYKAEKIALMHTELSEALEFLRMKSEPICPDCRNKLVRLNDAFGKPAMKCLDCDAIVAADIIVYPPAMDDKCPELTGEAAEMADTVIRILHYCGEFGIDLGEAIRKKHDFNITRPFRHGKNS